MEPEPELLLPPREPEPEIRSGDAQEDAEARRGFRAMMLAASLETCEALLRGQSVPLEALRPEEVARFGYRPGAEVANGRVVLDDFNDVRRDSDPAGEPESELELRAEQKSAAYEGLFLPAREFLTIEYPEAEPLLGTPGEVILARGSLLIVYGEGGSAKSTWTLDGVAHLAAGRDWLGIEVPRPVRFCLIENEGPPRLFRDKLEAKATEWDEPSDWLENVHVYANPWGGFAFTDPGAREALSAYCLEHKIDVVVANPLFGVGGPGAGKPEETQAFVELLKEVGLEANVAFWLLHHINKLGQVSGDWGRQPDTSVSLEQDGDRQRTKLSWEKTRWATTPSEGRPRKQVLEWVVEHKGFKVLEFESVGVPDDALRERLNEFLAANPRSAQSVVEREVKGDDKRLRTLLHGPGYAFEKGPRGAKLWSLASDSGVTADTEDTELEGFQHG